MYRLAWPLRFVAIILAGALLLTGVSLAVAPRLWLVANAHDQTPIELPDFQPLSQRTIVYDGFGLVIAVFERENSQPISLDQVPEPVIEALLATDRLFEAAVISGALTLDAARGSDGPFDPRIHAVRGQPGQMDCAAA